MKKLMVIGLLTMAVVLVYPALRRRGDTGPRAPSQTPNGPPAKSSRAALSLQVSASISSVCEQAGLSDLDHANCVLQALIDLSQGATATDNVAFPSPHVEGQPSPWFTKCDIGVSQDCAGSPASPRWNLQNAEIFNTFCNAAPSSIVASPATLSSTQSGWMHSLYKRGPPQLIANGLEIPRQIVSKADGGRNAKPPGQTATTTKVWASVLYNKQAACSIARILRNAPNGLAGLLASQAGADKPIIAAIDPGAMVVKTIWAAIGEDPESKLTDPVPVVDKSLYTESNQGTTWNRSTWTLNQQTAWTTSGHYVRIATLQKSVKCPDRVSTDPQSPPTLPLSCFSWISVADHAADLPALAHGLLFPDGPGAAKNQPTYLVLVGVNVMHLPPGYPQWRWSAFYWTKEMNSKFADQDSWKHFTSSAVDVVRSPSVTDWTSRTVCFNPYLEAMANPPGNGLVSNCLSCHQFAAYKPTTASGTNQDARTVGTCFGSPDTQGQVGVNGKCSSETEADYFARSLNTRFLWSVGDINSGSVQVPEVVTPSRTDAAHSQVQ
jgi:hypothetical protein